MGHDGEPGKRGFQGKDVSSFILSFHDNKGVLSNIAWVNNEWNELITFLQLEIESKQSNWRH